MRQNIARIDDVGTLALCVLNNLSRAVAVIDPRGLVLFENAAFGRLFGDEPRAVELLELIGAAADRTDRTGLREITCRDGRSFGIVTVALAQGLLVTAEDISERVAEQVRAAELARTDPLTLLGNRLMFCERLTALLANLDEPTKAAAVLTVDLDRFKIINDSLGATVGDALLRVVADRLRSAIRPGDRYGARLSSSNGSERRS